MRAFGGLGHFPQPFPLHLPGVLGFARAFAPFALFALVALVPVVGCSSSTTTSTPDAGSACPAAAPAEGDACDAPEGTRCIFGDGCSTSTVALACQSGKWARTAFTARCDGG